MALLKFDKYVKQIFTDKRAVMVNVGEIEKDKVSGQWNYTPNDLGKRLYLFVSMTFKNLKEASYYLEKSHKRIKPVIPKIGISLISIFGGMSKEEIAFLMDKHKEGEIVWFFDNVLKKFNEENQNGK